MQYPTGHFPLSVFTSKYKIFETQNFSVFAVELNDQYFIHIDINPQDIVSPNDLADFLDACCYKEFDECTTIYDFEILPDQYCHLLVDMPSNPLQEYLSDSYDSSEGLCSWLIAHINVTFEKMMKCNFLISSWFCTENIFLDNNKLKSTFFFFLFFLRSFQEIMLNKQIGIDNNLKALESVCEEIMETCTPVGMTTAQMYNYCIAPKLGLQYEGPSDFSEVYDAWEHSTCPLFIPSIEPVTQAANEYVEQQQLPRDAAGDRGFADIGGVGG